MKRFFRRRARILTERQAELRETEQQLLERLKAALALFGKDVADTDTRRLAQASSQLAELFLIVIAGEFNSGKSAFINALLGEKALKEGVTPTTDRINVIRYGPEPGERLLEDFVLEKVHPSPLLTELNIVDTPGTNAIIRRHEELTREFVPRSDLVLFVTSADRPFCETERVFLEHIRQWGKKIVMILNKVDILSSSETDQVLAFVRKNGTALLGVEPEVFPVTARGGLKAREAGDDNAWQESGMGAVERYLLETLDEGERVRLKLLNPLGVGLHISGTYLEAASLRLGTLEADTLAIKNMEGQLAAFRAQMLQTRENRLEPLLALLTDVEHRGIAFFDAHVRLGNIRALLSPKTLQEKFRFEVVGELEKRIDDEVQRIIDWLIEQNLKLWQDVNAYLDRRKLSRHKDEMIGEVGHSFDYNRKALLDSVGQSARTVISTYNREAEAAQLADELRDMLATTALAEVGAVGLGAILVTVLTGAVADVTGILFAAALAVGGFYIIPSKRRRVKADFQQKISELRASLLNALNRQLDGEVRMSLERVHNAIAPYTRFVRYQLEQLEQASVELTAVQAALSRLKNEIEAGDEGG